jgi:CRISPR/Cas system-associated exonuclease Cas4 (RecB family)
MADQQKLTHSRAACFRACPRKHYLRFELGLRPAETGYAMRVGSGYHEAHRAIDDNEDVELAIDSQVDDPFDKALIAAMLHGHLERWKGDAGVEAVAAEIPFEMPLINPETGAATPVWVVAGKIDRIVRLADGRLALMERKTTSKDFSPGGDYWVRIHMDMQLSIYLIAARQAGYDIDTILYDVTRRPQQRPLKATPEGNRKYKKDGTLYANQRDVDETPEEFAARVSATIMANPDYHYARIEIARLQQDLDECQQELWNQQLTIRQMQRNNQWYRNPDSCFEPYKCEYLSICENREDVTTSTPDGFIRVSDIHPELT